MKTKKMIATLVVALLSVTAGRYGKRLPYCRFQSGTDGMCQLRTKGEEQYQVRERA